MCVKRKLYGLLLISTSIGVLIGLLMGPTRQVELVAYCLAILGMLLLIVDKIKRGIRSKAPVWIRLALMLMTSLFFVVGILTKSVSFIITAIVYLECTILIAF